VYGDRHRPVLFHDELRPPVVLTLDKRSQGADRSARSVNGILLLYHHPPRLSAPTIMDHVLAFERHSQFKVWSVNTDHGFPKTLTSLDFATIVLHYSLFGIAPYQLNEYFYEYLANSRAYKIAFFQDEYHYCKPRFEFLNRYGIDCVYTLLQPEQWDDVYRLYTRVPKLVHGIPGYVSDELVSLAERLTIPDDERDIDIGYRGRSLPAYMGRAAQEKSEIGQRFAERAHAYGLTLDIAVDEDSRIYGEDWFRFLANCRGVLGVEAGVSVFDLDDSVREQYEQLAAAHPDVTFEEIETRILGPKENNIFYRTVSPRHFEAAAFRVCQILFEGAYSHVLEPMAHYIPLHKDFSNFEEVVARFRDRDLRRRLTENAYRDLIASGAYSYRRFIEDFDRELFAMGFDPQADEPAAVRLTSALERDRCKLGVERRISELISRPFPGRRLLRPLLKPVRSSLRRWKYHRWEKRARRVRRPRQAS
jgi:hypothetical protein